MSFKSILENSRQDGKTMVVELEWPASKEAEITHIEVGLMCLRAADSVRISYDYDRDGWKIEQASKFEFEDPSDMDPDWQEVAFVQAWGRQKKNES